jgi:hypothetical protein
VDFDYRDGDALCFHTSEFRSLTEPRVGIEDLI